LGGSSNKNRYLHEFSKYLFFVVSGNQNQQLTAALSIELKNHNFTHHACFVSMHSIEYDVMFIVSKRDRV